jgi:tRNA threonylcarbamoyl adenosine modification protein YeaZ
VQASRSHAELLNGEISELLRQCGVGIDQLTRIVVGTGPGGFTGLRVGITTGRTLALALGITCDGVLTLDAMARAALDAELVAGDFVVALDARRREVFWAQYSKGKRVTAPAAITPQRLLDDHQSDLVVVGNIAASYPIFANVIDAVPSAAAIATIASAHDGVFEVMHPTPVYVRTPDATEPVARVK